MIRSLKHSCSTRARAGSTTAEICDEATRIGWTPHALFRDSTRVPVEIWFCVQAHGEVARILSKGCPAAEVIADCKGRLPSHYMKVTFRLMQPLPMALRFSHTCLAAAQWSLPRAR